MLLFGKVSGNLPDCEKHHPENNEDSIPHYLPDSQHHSDTIFRSVGGALTLWRPNGAEGQGAPCGADAENAESFCGMRKAV